MDPQHQYAVDVGPAAADAPQAGDEDVQNSGPPQEAAAAAAAAAGGDASPGNAAVQGQSAAAQQASPGNAAAHDADAQESQVERTIGVGEITLTENLNDTRHIDILIKQSNGPQPQASGVGAAPEDTAALNGRLKITVVVEKDADKELMAMRGWLMTVGTLFVTMAFQAALHPPEWMRTVDFLRINQSDINGFKHLFRGASHAAATAPAKIAPSPGPSPQAAESTRSLYWRAGLYMCFNAVTFATALWLVLMLLRDIPRARAKRTTKGARFMMVVMGISAMVTFALGSSAQWFSTLAIGILMWGYASIVVWCLG